MPMMQVSQKLVDNGVQVTFAITESLHKQLLANLSSSLKEGVHNDPHRIRLVSRPEGLEYQNQEKASDYLEELVMKINEINGGNNGEEKVSCVIADAGVYWAYEPAKKMGLKIAMFCPTSLAVTAMTLHIPKLIEAGIIDEN
ncbi:UDP-glycosyltransferase 83A1-like [Papaver somniferum]|uniref:UDP-glycosyltransferase 83A1-like n=1 Tax=Papaver somniferum TaxID=3469 RepID=UPI000E6F493A|nr:UDP-glycosyltransferase 83A1-like [Papaver somniferum]